MVFFRIALQCKVMRTLVQILQAQQGANPLVEWELVADHDVEVATGVGQVLLKRIKK